MIQAALRQVHLVPVWAFTCQQIVAIASIGLVAVARHQTPDELTDAVVIVTGAAGVELLIAAFAGPALIATELPGARSHILDFALGGWLLAGLALLCRPWRLRSRRAQRGAPTGGRTTPAVEPLSEDAGASRTRPAKGS
jgi:hypothetical protein